ncbi:MAG: cyclic nucleotide-binding domain-containing protein [Acidobacteria bacterium]|nr:cyclic nucleotide-binding domain-containing protein [Acidobacteriota bacterium]
MRKVLFLFSSLNDDDVEWLISAGTLQRVTAGDVLVEQDGVLDSLFIVVAGTFAVSVTGPPVDETAHHAPKVEPRVVAYLQAGDIVGEMSFIDSYPPSGTVTAVEDSRVLAISRARLNERLIVGTFGLRFYRAIAVLLSHRLRAANARLRDAAVGPGREGTDTVSEVDPGLIEAVSVAGARFAHLVRQLGV